MAGASAGWTVSDDLDTTGRRPRGIRQVSDLSPQERELYEAHERTLPALRALCAQRDPLDPESVYLHLDREPASIPTLSRVMGEPQDRIRIAVLHLVQHGRIRAVARRRFGARVLTVWGVPRG